MDRSSLWKVLVNYQKKGDNLMELMIKESYWKHRLFVLEYFVREDKVVTK